MGVLEKWAQHRTTDDAEDNVAQWGSLAIRLLNRADPVSNARWLDAGAGGVLRGIAAADMSVASTAAKNEARYALIEIGHKA